MKKEKQKYIVINFKDSTYRNCDTKKQAEEYICYITDIIHDNEGDIIVIKGNVLTHIVTNTKVQINIIE